MITNAKTPPKRYYGLHMVPGLAEYRQDGKSPVRILIEEDTIKSMDPTFEAKPLYVGHVNQVNLENLETEMAGVVVRSFWNKCDGKSWAEFLVTSDKGHEAIAHGWKLSNAYIPKDKAPGGVYHGVDYQEEITKAEYEHLAIVQDPRYSESVILTPEQFKEYNERKEKELQMLTNEKEGDKSMLSFFKKAKVENSSDIENTVVMLPKSKKEYTIGELVKNADVMEESKDKPKMANGEDMVEVGNEKMSVNDLVKKHMEMCDSMKKNDDENLKEEEQKQVKNKEEEEKEKKENEEEEEKKKEEVKKNALEAKAKEEKQKRFDTLKNAHVHKAPIRNVEVSIDEIARGKQRYGSK